MADPQPTKAITLRAVLLGLFGVAAISLLTPYSDYALKNSAIIGFNLPVGIVLALFLFALLINGPLSRFRPNWAFSSGELTIVLVMLLAGCAVPSCGLMRYFPASLVTPFVNGQGNLDFQHMWEEMNLPRWLFPSYASDNPTEWGNDPIATGFVSRWQGAGGSPYAAWVRPMLVWGLLFAGLWMAILCMLTLVQRQWFENERLPFPLAQIQMSLVECPTPGRWLNSIYSSRSFWIGFSVVVALRLWNGAGTYWPQFVPAIPTGFDLSMLFSEEPLSYAAPYVRKASVWFTVIGVAYFLSGSVTLSLWLFPVLAVIYQVGKGVTTGDPTLPGQWEEHLGAVLAFSVAVIWIGRKHFRLILVQAFRGTREGEPQGRFMSYPFAFWLLMGCIALMIGWFWMAGASLIGAATIVLLLLLLFMVIARVVAETGLIYGQLLIPIYRPWTLLGSYGFIRPVSLETFYLSSLTQVSFYDFREPFSVYASHGMKVAQEMIPLEGEPTPRTRVIGRRLIGLMAISVVLAYVLSFSSLLWTEYNYAFSQDASQSYPINSWGTVGAQRNYVLNPSSTYYRDRYGAENYDPLTHIGVGAAISAGLSVMRLRFAWWPLHPVGFLMYPTTPAQVIWFSLMLGWLAKTLMLRLGGAGMYQSAKPLFIGLIVGECVAAGLWGAITIGLYLLGVPYHPIDLMLVG